ncbi:GTPase activating protein 1 [Heracleum sosnowskyi]|uniref:GTPase activating protein 1 n=1 Tax=Heracleum sosnowskyi TaxID=360622 RepID=A0AAD8I8B7_9APIA|nr:GTPase activating protein 1 [Heracleum sosnowskyi]
MDDLLGLLKVRVRRGINLAIRDAVSSDPYVVLSMGRQKFKTHVINDNCNPEWNDELTLSVKDLSLPVKLTVYDKDVFSIDDKMGEAVVDISDYIQCIRMGLQNLPDGTVVHKVHPDRNNCLSEESTIVWNKGKMTQDMFLRLKNVESGELEIGIEWVEVPGTKGVM